MPELGNQLLLGYEFNHRIVYVHVEGTEEFASNLGLIRDQAFEVIWHQQGLLNPMMLWGDQKLGNFHFSYDSGKWVAGIHCKFIYESVPQNWEYCFSHRSEERGERRLCDFPAPSAGISNQREHSRPEFVLGGSEQLITLGNTQQVSEDSCWGPRWLFWGAGARLHIFMTSPL